MIEEEGVRYEVYRDVAGYPTVGVGHLVLPQDNLRVGDRISHQRAVSLLERDLAKAEKIARRLLGDLPVNQHEFDALVDLAFNVGEGNLSRKRSPRLNRAIASADYNAIADELSYTTAAGRVANGLINRSRRRTQIFAKNDYSDPRTA
ncbi:Lysozyme RrrD [Erythrobacter sp. THAF29]|nr:Lysozyme RrrD [Erythrobacter sp. THAF29]